MLAWHCFGDNFEFYAEVLIHHILCTTKKNTSDYTAPICY